MHNKNFTLVELLVVIGIIAVLAALLLPALSASRSKARRIQDLSNMKQVGIGLQSYSDMSKGYMPCIEKRVIAGLNAYLSGGWYAWIVDKPSGVGQLFASGNVDNPRIFFCTEPFAAQGTLMTYDNPVDGWTNWNQAGKYVKLSITLPIVMYSKCDLAAAKNYWTAQNAGMSEFPMSNILSDNTKKVILSCYTVTDDNDKWKSPHDRAGVNTIFGDNSGRWQKIEWSGSDAPEPGWTGSYIFGWLNAHSKR